jgi:hypothetical protein
MVYTFLPQNSIKTGQLPALNPLILNHISSAQFLLELDCDVPQEGVNSNCRIETPALKTLYNCLKKRSEHGLGPQKLRVDLRGLQPEQVDKKATALMEKVVEIVWVMDLDLRTQTQTQTHTQTCWFINVYC